MPHWNQDASRQIEANFQVLILSTPNTTTPSSFFFLVLEVKLRGSKSLTWHFGLLSPWMCLSRTHTIKCSGHTFQVFAEVSVSAGVYVNFTQVESLGKKPELAWTGWEERPHQICLQVPTLTWHFLSVWSGSAQPTVGAATSGQVFLEYRRKQPEPLLHGLCSSPYFQVPAWFPALVYYLSDRLKN